MTIENNNQMMDKNIENKTVCKHKTSMMSLYVVI